MRKARWVLPLLAALLLAGCGSLLRPVDVPEDSSPSPAATAASTAGYSPTTAPALPAGNTPTPAPEQPKAYSFPLDAAALCGSEPLPEGFSRPLYIDAGGSMFLYATADGRVAEALWDGAGYSSVPIVEGVATAPGSDVYQDLANGRLCCAGSKLFPDGRTGPDVVVVDTRTGARCNADDLSGWKEKDCALSASFQYCGGTILSQIVKYGDGAYTPIDRWAAVDVGGKSCTVLDMSDFLQNNLPEWQNLVSYRLALTGPRQLLAFCLAHKADPATGADEYACFAFELDLKGRVQGSAEIVPGGKQPQDLAVLGASAFDASPDGKYLLYTDSQGLGVYLYDVEGNAEYTVLGAGSRSRVFAQWGPDDAVYYGAADQAESEITIYRTSANEVITGK